MTLASVNLTNVWVGKYHFRKLLGRGGSASVWLADETNLHRAVIRPVAIKVFIANFADRSAFQEAFSSFQLDLQFLADLAPDNPIVQYYNSETADLEVKADGSVSTLTQRSDGAPSPEETVSITAFLIVMEYADGGALGRTYREEIILRDDKIFIDHFIDICMALRAAHAKEIIHRDIKPSNLMWFRKANKVKVGDFGIAQHLNDLRPSGMYLLGTPAYMSPESFRSGTPATPQRDVYALGCTFYEVLTGSMPFNPFEKTAKVPADGFELFRNDHESAERPDAIVKAPTVVSVSVSALIKRMMHRDPALRPTLDQVVDSLWKEKQIGAESIPQIQQTVLPKKPEYLSSHYVHPLFRRKHLKQSAVFVFLRIDVQTAFKYKQLFHLLRLFFRDTFSIFEVYGQYDFVVRMWTTRERVTHFIERLITEVLDNIKEAVRVMVCDDVSYLGTSPGEPTHDLSIPQVLAKIEEAQTESQTHRETLKSAVDWLVRHKILLKRRDFNLDGNKVKGLTLVSRSGHVSEADREAGCALIIRHLEQSGIARKTDLSVYMKAYAPIEGFENERSDYVVSYVAPTFNDMVTITSILLDELAAQGFKLSSSLVTKRYYVDSDRA